MLTRIMALVITVVLLGFGIVWLTPTSAPNTPISLVTADPSPVPTLPACEYEDGSGQMLCFWDASEQGNEIGTDVVAGDCSIDTVGSKEASMVCVQLYPMPARTSNSPDGAVITVPAGKALVNECLDIAFDASLDEDAAKALQDDGWNLTECFRSFIEN
jgi:hypothetical protein